MALSPRDRRILLILGPIVVVLLGIYLLFLRGGGEEEAPPVVQPPITQSPTPTVSPTETLPPILVFTGRDPFKAPIASPGATTTIPPGGTTTTPPGGTTTTGPAPSVSPAGTPSPGPGGGSSTTLGGHTVVLDNTFTSGGAQMAQVEVDGTVFTVAEGESFDDNFQLVAVSGDCADFLFGDQPFTLCTSGGK
jgi:hypothetical protein